MFGHVWVKSPSRLGHVWVTFDWCLGHVWTMIGVSVWAMFGTCLCSNYLTPPASAKRFWLCIKILLCWQGELVLPHVRGSSHSDILILPSWYCRLSISDMHLGCAYRICISDTHFRDVYPLCVSALDIQDADPILKRKNSLELTCVHVLVTTSARR